MEVGFVLKIVSVFFAGVSIGFAISALMSVRSLMRENPYLPPAHKKRLAGMTGGEK